MLGALISLFTIVITLSYGLHRSKTMWKYGDTVHQRTEDAIEYTIENPLDYTESKVSIAVNIIDTKTLRLSEKNIESYVEVSFAYRYSDKSNPSEVIREATSISAHECTTKDIETYFPGTSDIDAYFLSKNGYCIDDASSLSLYGSGYDV